MKSAGATVCGGLLTPEAYSVRDFVKARCVGVVVTLFHLADHFFGSVKAVGEMAVVLLIAGFVSAAFKFVNGGASWC